MELVQEKFRPIASSAKITNGALKVASIHASFGSINRSDVTDVSLRKTDDGFLLVADVKYRPSVMFWVIFVVGVFTYVFWLLPIIFYLIQKNTVKSAIEDCFRSIKNETSTSQPFSPQPTSGSTAVADLERLGNLLQQGLITQEEFASQKQKVFGTSPLITSPIVVSTEKRSQNNPPLPLSLQNETDENTANQLFERARKCVQSGEKSMAIDLLNDLVERFPNTNAATKAKKSLGNRGKN